MFVLEAWSDGVRAYTFYMVLSHKFSLRNSSLTKIGLSGSSLNREGTIVFQYCLKNANYLIYTYDFRN